MKRTELNTSKKTAAPICSGVIFDKKPLEYLFLPLPVKRLPSIFTMLLSRSFSLLIILKNSPADNRADNP